MAVCAKCGAALAEGVGFCGSCGTPVAAGGPGPTAPPAPGAPAAEGLTSNVAGALAYVTIIPAILFLVLEPYNKDKFVRFHSFQCIFFTAAWCVLAFALFIVSWILAFIPILGWILGVLLWLALMLGMFGVWIFLVYKAYNNQRFLLPVLGKLAAQQAG